MFMFSEVWVLYASIQNHWKLFVDDWCLGHAESSQNISSAGDIDAAKIHKHKDRKQKMI